MAELILFLFLLIPAMLGLAEILHLIKTYILYPHKTDSCMVVYLKGENPVGRLKFALEQYCWLGKRYIGNIIAVSSGLDGEDYDICREIALNHGIIFCGEDELPIIFEKIRM